jgi:predicted ester cyclase
MIHYVSTGTNEGSWLGKPATGRKIHINEVSIFRIEDSKIAEQWLMPDIFNMQQQLLR